MTQMTSAEWIRRNRELRARGINPMSYDTSVARRRRAREARQRELHKAAFSYAQDRDEPIPPPLPAPRVRGEAPLRRTSEIPQERIDAYIRRQQRELDEIER